MSNDTDLSQVLEDLSVVNIAGISLQTDLTTKQLAQYFTLRALEIPVEMSDRGSRAGREDFNLLGPTSGLATLGGIVVVVPCCRLIRAKMRKDQQLLKCFNSNLVLVLLLLIVGLISLLLIQLVQHELGSNILGNLLAGARGSD